MDNTLSMLDVFKSEVGSNKSVNEQPQDVVLDAISDPQSVRIEDLPRIIDDQVIAIGKLEKNIDKALKNAKESKDSAAHAEAVASNMSLLGGRRDAIHALQKAGYKLSDAVCSNTDALQLAFKSLQKLAETTKYLFVLGVSNIAVNRMVVRELELKLKGASTGQLSELAKKEVMCVVAQLKAQEDLLIKQEKLAQKMRTHGDQLQMQIAKDAQHDELLNLGAEKDRKQDEQLQKQADKNLQYEDALRKLATKYGKLEAALATLQESQKELRECTNQNFGLIQELKTTIENFLGGRAWIPLSLSLTALIGTAIMFVLRFY